MRKSKLNSLLTASVLSTLAAAPVYAEESRVVVTIENLAPEQGTFQTPFWVGIHDGHTFDTYNGNTPASSRPIQGSNAMESLCEDGSTASITADFATLVPGGVDATVPGPNGPIAPGDVTSVSFVVDSEDPNSRYFSYASMVIPSNDFCLSNGNPKAHEVFDEEGNFVATDFFVTGAQALDAGTEVNDELPENTAFFGQQAPNTGVDENGLIGTIGQDRTDITGFQPAGSGGVLDDPRFAMSDFSVAGYPFVKISFAEAPAVTEDAVFVSKINGKQEVPPVRSRARGFAIYELRDNGEEIKFAHWFQRLRNVTMAHLHYAPAGENGPVIVDLLAIGEAKKSRNGRRLRALSGTITSADLVGPLQGMPLDVLSQAMIDGDVYINIHTERNPAGEIRGQIRFKK